MTDRAGRRLKHIGAVNMILRMGTGMAFCVFAGLWLDRVLGTGPWLLVTGVLVGAAAALLELFLRSVRDQRHKGKSGG